MTVNTSDGAHAHRPAVQRRHAQHQLQNWFWNMKMAKMKKMPARLAVQRHVEPRHRNSAKSTSGWSAALPAPEQVAEGRPAGNQHGSSSHARAIGREHFRP